LDEQVQIRKGGYYISFTHPKNEQWATDLEHMGILVRTYPTEDCILRCGVPRSEADWNRLENAVNSLGD